MTDAATDRPRFLVTGGAGFVGCNLVRGLLARFPDSKVRVLDDLSTGATAQLPTHTQLDMVEGSVEDSALVDKLVRDADIVFHLAARNIIASTNDPRSDFSTNIGGTLNVLLAARDVGNVKVVYSSSASVYGNPRYLPINEDDPLTTLTPYAVSKLSGENYCVAFYERFRVPTVCLRYSNVYGPWQDPRNPYCGVIAKFLEWVAQGKPVRIHGDGLQTRDFTFVEDTVDATIRAAFSERGDGGVFNVATGVETTVHQLAEAILGLYASGAGVERIERRDIDNIRRRVLNIERARRILHWSPTTILSEGLQSTRAWYESIL